MLNMNIADPVGGVVSIVAEGKINAVSAPQLEEAVNNVFEGGNKDIKLDMSKVDYLSSAGIRVLVMAYKKAAKNEGSFSVLNPSSMVKDVLEITGMYEMLVK